MVGHPLGAIAEKTVFERSIVHMLLRVHVLLRLMLTEATTLRELGRLVWV